MTQIQVVWHKNPDTDCTLSAIITADFLSQKWYIATPYIQGEINNETDYLLKTYGIQKPEIKTILDTNIEVCLVDHNEASQAPDNLSELNVTWLIDHHKIHFSSSSPLNVRIEPICSTASVLYKMYRENNFEITQKIAVMMLACIMSDSLLWKSPTSTDEDKIIATELQKIADIQNLEDFSMPMFDAKSDLWDLSGKDILLSDYKIFEVNWYKYWSWAVETTSPAPVIERKEELLKAMQEVKQEQWLDFIILSVVDILSEKNSTLSLDWEDSNIISTVFATDVVNNISNLWARLSRKKQIIPDLTEYFNAK